MNLNDLKIGQRLALGFGAVLALAVAIAGVSYLLLLDSKAEQAALAALEHRAQLVSDWEAKTALNVTRTIAIAKSSHAGTAAHFGPLMQETSAQISALQKELDSGTASAQGKALLAAIGEKRKTYLDLRKQLSEVARGGDAAATEAVLTGQVLPASQAYLASMGALRDYQLGASAEKQAQLVAAIERGETTLIVLLLASLAVGAAMAVFITRSVTRPVREAVATAQTIAGGDLSHTLRSTRRDELGELLRALGRMQESLRGLVGDVRLITDSVNTASAEISTGNHDLSARTEQAASSLQETAASMEQITATVRRSSESTQRADQLATSAAAVAQRGGQVVSDVVSTMSEINSSSRRIADIIGVIDGIAFQTNILALNAAVEAARAGEHGRGFAVVASEVRTLAQRSAGAAKEIKGLISASVDKVDSGSRLVADAGSTMQEIVASVQRVTQIIREINAGAAEQSQGIGQVNEAVTQLDQMTQQNAALVEQSAAAAESLKDQAHRLVRVVGSFRTAAA